MLDAAGFDTFFNQAAPTAYGVALRVLRDPALAEEVAQDVLTELWVHPGRYDPSRGTPAALAGTMAHRRAVDRVRAVEAGRRRDRAWVDAGLIADPVFDAVAADDTSRKVRAALAFLSPAQRVSIELAFYEGLTYRQIADTVHASLPAVKSRIRDGLIRLRDQLDGVGLRSTGGPGPA